MAGQLRSSVGFLGGGGVTPSPTPTPKARLARFILAQYGVSGEVQVLTDTYGRILTQYTQDGDYRTACVYVPGDSRIDWDTASDTELVTLLGKYGYNDAITIVDNNVTINDNGETETLIWDSAAMDFTVDVDMFQNGTQNMFFRTVNDGSRDVTVLCDADGKAIMAPTLGEYSGVLFSVANNGTEIDTITSDGSISAAAVIQACGGSVNVTALDAGESVFLLVKGTHVQFCNADDLATTPEIEEYLEALTWGSGPGGASILSAGSKFLVLTQGSSKYAVVNQSGEISASSALADAIISSPHVLWPMSKYEDQYDFEFTYKNVDYVVEVGEMTPAI